MNQRGAGDRWLSGEPIDGVVFPLHAVVDIVGGRYDGDRGVVILLMALGDDPLYLVRVHSSADEVRVRQSLLHRAE